MRYEVKRPKDAQGVVLLQLSGRSVRMEPGGKTVASLTEPQVRQLRRDGYEVAPHQETAARPRVSKPTKGEADAVRAE